MRLTPCKDQGSKTLEAFYEDLTHSASYVLREGSRAMLDLIARLRASPDSRQVFGLTSHEQLILHAEDTYLSPRFVIVAAYGHRYYRVEYLMPASIAPWQSAYVRGECQSEGEAAQMIETAMERCEGWPSPPSRSG